MKNADPHLTVHDLNVWAKGSRANSFENMLRLERLVLVAVAAHFLVIPVAAPTCEAEWIEFEKQIPARYLAAALDWESDGRQFAPWLLEACPELLRVPSYGKDYRKAFAHVLRHAFATHTMSLAHVGLSPQWIEALAPLLELPCTDETLTLWRERGERQFHGISLERDPKKVKRYACAIRDNTRVLARRLTALGAVAPELVTAETIHGSDDSFYAQMMKQNPDAGTRITRASQGWAILRENNPALIEWPRPSEEREYGYGVEQQHPIFKLMIEEITRLMQEADLADATIYNTVQPLIRMFGHHQNTCGRPLDGLFDKDNTSKHVAWLTCAGHPFDDRERPIERQIERVLTETDHRERLIKELPNVNRRHPANGVCAANPFVVDFVLRLIREQRADAAGSVLKAVKCVCIRYLGVDKGQLDWIKELGKRVQKAKQKQAPSEQAKRKQAIGDADDLWSTLVAARPRLARHTAACKEKMLADPTTANGLSWATAVRDELLVAFLLAFHLRPSNLEKLKLEEDIFPDSYKVWLPDHKMKAQRGVLKDFSRGYFADLVALFDTYFYEARDVLLDGRGSPYLFVSQRKNFEAKDKDDNLTVGKDFAAHVLAGLFRKFFADLLPPGYDRLTPGEFRHLFTSHLSQAGMPASLEAQALGHDPQTAQRHYEMIAKQNDGKLSQYVRYAEDKAKIVRVVQKGKARKALRQAIESTLPPETAKRTTSEIIRHVDAFLALVGG